MLTGRRLIVSLLAIASIGTVIALALVIGNGGSSADISGREHHVIDEMAGTFRGASFGDSKREVIARFGTSPPLGNHRITPLKVGFNDSSAPSWNCRPPGISPTDLVKVKLSVLRYDYVSVGLTDNQTCDFIIDERGAATDRGVAVGDPLDEARAAYGGLLCDTAPLYEDSDSPRYPYCKGRVAPRRHIWFGGDPIKTIQLNTQGVY